MSRGRKRRKAAEQAAALAACRVDVPGPLPLRPPFAEAIAALVPASPHALPSYADCTPLDWVPDLGNAILQSAAAGRLSIGDPFHRPPAPITFTPPRARR